MSPGDFFSVTWRAPEGSFCVTRPEDVGTLHFTRFFPMRLSMALDSPLLLVLDDAVDSETCEKIISLSSRRAPQEIPVTDEAAGTSTLKRKFPVTSSSWMAAAPSEAVQAEEAALQTVTTLVMEMLQSQTTEAETPPNVHCTEPSAASGLTLGLHVDTNMKPDRFATALLYLRDVPAGGGGETIFPLGEDSMHPHPLASAAQRLLDCECTHTRHAHAYACHTLDPSWSQRLLGYVRPRAPSPA